MSTPKNVTPKNVADATVNKKQEKPTVVEDAKIPNQTTAEPETTETAEETPKVTLATKAKAFVKKNRNTLLFAASVGAILLGVKSAKKARVEEPELIVDETVEPDGDNTNTDEG